VPMAAYDGGPTPEDMSAFLAELKAAAEVPPVVAPAAAPAATDARVSRHLECATADVTHVMGLRGENVALYEQQSGASIKVAHGVQRRGQPARSRVLLDGPGAAVSHAARVIKEKLDEVKSPRHIQCPRAVIGKARHARERLITPWGPSGLLAGLVACGTRDSSAVRSSAATATASRRSRRSRAPTSRSTSAATRASSRSPARRPSSPRPPTSSSPPWCVGRARSDRERPRLVSWLVSQEGRYASALGTIADAHATHDRIIDPYREVDRNWYPARDEVGRVYWYHAHTGKTQWQNPYQPA